MINKKYEDLYEESYHPLLKDIKAEINGQHGPKGKIQYCKHVNFPKIDL